MMEFKKPPLGVSPHWFVYTNRMKELNETIGRWLDHIKSIHNCGYTKQCFEAIAGWAKEIEKLALLEAELERSKTDE